MGGGQILSDGGGEILSEGRVGPAVFPLRKVLAWFVLMDFANEFCGVGFHT
jgi:hypothetical protein